VVVGIEFSLGVCCCALVLRGLVHRGSSWHQAWRVRSPWLLVLYSDVLGSTLLLLDLLLRLLLLLHVSDDVVADSHDIDLLTLVGLDVLSQG
jgi:hypothetical protein